jgi:hypothetical protein
LESAIALQSAISAFAGGPIGKVGNDDAKTFVEGD